MSQDEVGIAVGLIMILVWFVVVGGALALTIWITWRIMAKTGYSGALALLCLVPFGSLALMLLLAFGDWPVLRDLRAQRQQFGP